MDDRKMLMSALSDALDFQVMAAKRRAEAIEIIEELELPQFKEEEVLQMIDDYLTVSDVGGMVVQTGENDSVSDIVDQACDDLNARLYKAYMRHYQQLYDSKDSVPGIEEAYDLAMSFAESNEDILRSFEEYQEDLVTSDREISAFGFAIDEVFSPGINTRMSYLYRDCANYKQREGNEVVVRGILTESDKKAIISSLDGDNFIPRQIGLPEVRFPYPDDPDLDHCFFELADEPFELTNDPPTMAMSASQLADAFKSVKEWNDFSYLSEVEERSTDDE